MGTDDGCRIANATNRSKPWGDAILIPGATYSGLPAPPTPAPTPAPPGGSTSQPTLRMGSRGPAVSTMQRILRDRGGYQIAVDGVFGPQTDRIVRAFQKSAAPPADGIVGPVTWAALNRLNSRNGPF